MAQGVQLKTISRCATSIMALQFHIAVYIIQDNLPRVRAGVANHHLQLSNMLDFEGTETTGNRILNFLRCFSYDLFLIQVYTLQILFLIVLQTYEQKKCTLHCAQHVCY